MRFPAGAAIVDKQVDRSPAERLLARATQLYEKTCQQGFDSRKAIGMGIELEQDFCKIHLGNSVEIIDDKLKKMFAALAHDDKTHEQKLIDAKEKSGLAKPAGIKKMAPFRLSERGHLQS